MKQSKANIQVNFLHSVAKVIREARSFAYKSTNTILLRMYWEIGKLIIEEEQQGSSRAAYGKGVLKDLAKGLTLEFGKGFDESNLCNMRRFFLAFPILDAVGQELSWTHYRIISRIENELINSKTFKLTFNTIDMFILNFLKFLMVKFTRIVKPNFCIKTNTIFN